VLKSALTHPQLTAALAGAGHGALVLVADGNYPASTRVGPNAQLVYLNVRPGLVDAVTILGLVLASVPVEEALVMAPMAAGPYALEEEPAIWAEFRALLDAAQVQPPMRALERSAFYDAASSQDVALSIVSGEARIYGNVLLRIGVVLP
jgi:L-fucose mutarotase